MTTEEINARVLGAVYNFAAGLTTNPEVIAVGATEDSAYVAERLKQWADAHGFIGVEPDMREPYITVG